ncbi:MAG: hypothetical protein U0228_11590, partial [Myxococcaceae bacterium]
RGRAAADLALPRGAHRQRRALSLNESAPDGRVQHMRIQLIAVAAVSSVLVSACPGDTVYRYLTGGFQDASRAKSVLGQTIRIDKGAANVASSQIAELRGGSADSYVGSLNDQEKAGLEAKVKAAIQASRVDSSATGCLPKLAIEGETSFSVSSVEAVSLKNVITAPIDRKGAWCRNPATVCCENGKAAANLDGVCGKEVAVAIYEATANITLNSTAKVGAQAGVEFECESVDGGISVSAQVGDEHRLTLKNTGWSVVQTLPLDQACAAAKGLPPCEGCEDAPRFVYPADKPLGALPLAMNTGVQLPAITRFCEGTLVSARLTGLAIHNGDADDADTWIEFGLQIGDSVTRYSSAPLSGHAGLREVDLHLFNIKVGPQGLVPTLTLTMATNSRAQKNGATLKNLRIEVERQLTVK